MHEPMIRISRETAELLREVDNAEYIRPSFGAGEAAHVLSSKAPIYSTCGGMLISGQDILANAEGDDDPMAARVWSDVAKDFKRSF